MVAEERGLSRAPVGVQVHVESARDDREDEGADKTHLTHGGTPVGPPVAQAMAGGGCLLTFRVIAAHVSAVVDGPLPLLLRGVGGWGPWPGPLLALGCNCRQWS